VKTSIRSFVLAIVPIVLLLNGCSSSTTTTSSSSSSSVPVPANGDGPTARDLFYREGTGSGGSGGSSGAPPSSGNSGGKPAIAYCLELTRDGAEPVPCDNRFVFKSGDALRLHIKVNQPFYVYVLSIGSTGQKSALYPRSADEDNRLAPDKECIVPPKGQMVFDDHPGTENLGVFFTTEPLKPERALELKGEVIDSRALTGTPMTVGNLSVVSGFGTSYELGEPVEGDGQVYISSERSTEPIGFEIILNHTKDGNAHSAAPNSSSNSGAGAGGNSQVAEGETIYGIVPPYLLKDMANRNPDNRSLNRTLDLMDTLHDQSGSRAMGGPEEHAKIEVYDANGGMQEALPGTKARFEGDPPTGKYETDTVYDYSGQVRDFYKEVFNRDSIDGNGMKIVSTENFGHDYENAFWDGAQMTYGAPSADSPFSTVVLLDVCGHEMTHGVTSAENNLEYWGQSGALNESISDVFGILIKQKANHQAAADSNWVLGEGIWKAGIKGRGLRDMMHPGTAYDDPRVGKDDQPAHMDAYIKTTRDRGGVHHNSGIPNRAFALFATDVGGNAWEEPGKIWFETRKVVGPTPSFAQFAFQTIESAKKLGFEDDVPKLEKAWEAVGVTPSETEGDTLTPPKPAEPPHPSS
jgi:hypothetical protein